MRKNTMMLMALMGLITTGSTEAPCSTRGVPPSALTKIRRCTDEGKTRESKIADFGHQIRRFW